MKYICLGYMNEQVWETLSESERNTYMDECFIYDNELRKNGHFASGEALQGAMNATTLRWGSGKVSIIDGPFAETKEQIGGIMILEATDLNHVIRLLSKHPSLKLGRGSCSWEIRPSADLTALIAESEQRRKA
ncbi:YciI family protein [Rhodocytophaga aerolata]|uniref:YciI family protein n=1 Tax=Rhodocytophaga aerolata TaxID=455078 RepID=A0ABT8RIH5_9BACT|nr:YciI family protein [Rhodocytophaga aerolata]MDO1451912.1 YciI family protein [Rhodocytophaga aerolata]